MSVIDGIEKRPRIGWRLILAQAEPSINSGLYGFGAISRAIRRFHPDGIKAILVNLDGLV
jgi:hypothetical protein